MEKNDFNFIYRIVGKFGGLAVYITTAKLKSAKISYLHTVKPEILAGIKFGGWAQNRYFKNIGGFKFGGSVRDRHTYICE